MTINPDNLPVEQYNAMAALTFADFILGKRRDYLPTIYTGTEEPDNNQPKPEAEVKRAHKYAADTLAQAEADSKPGGHNAVGKTTTTVMPAPKAWADNLLDRTNPHNS